MKWLTGGSLKRRAPRMAAECCPGGAQGDRPPWEGTELHGMVVKWWPGEAIRAPWMMLDSTGGGLPQMVAVKRGSGSAFQAGGPDWQARVS